MTTQSEILLKQYAQEQSTLLEIAKRIAQGGALDALLQDLAAMALRGFAADGVRIVLPSTNGFKGFSAGPAGPEMEAFDYSVWAHTVAHGALLQQDMSKLQTLNGAKTKYKSVAAFPLLVMGQQGGVLWAGYRKTHQFNQAEENFGGIIAAQASVAVANAYAFESAQFQRERLAAILNSSADPILMINTEGWITMINPAAEAACGIKNAHGKKVESVLPNVEALLPLLNGEPSNEVVEWENGNGLIFSPRITEVRDDSGKLTGRVLTLRDITHYRTFSDNQAEFTSTISHDMRLPLTYMKGYLDMMPMVGQVNEKQETFLDKIATGITELTDLVEKILDASKLDPMGNYQLTREPSDIGEIIHDAMTIQTPMAERKKIKLISDVSRTLPILNVDQGMLKRAINNLIDNAIKYTPDGGTVTVRANAQGDSLSISVIDTGEGISEEDQKKLFSRFKRIRKRGQERIKGTGLGLYIVKRLAQRHGGDATLTSELGKGSTFTIHIPMSGENLLGGAAGA
jgi:PAS domain S-box-containing protein